MAPSSGEIQDVVITEHTQRLHHGLRGFTMQVGVKCESVHGHMIICLSDFAVGAFHMYVLYVSDLISLLCNFNS